MESMSITNYDVLVEPPMQGRSGDYQLDKHKSHVGNNRLQVFLNLYQQGYNSARQRGDFNECNIIVDKIVGTVCHQCVPRGRFLVSSVVGNGTVVWNQMEEPSAKALLHKVLQPTKPVMNHIGLSQDDEGQKRRRRSSLLRRSASESVVGLVSDSKKKLTRMEQFIEEYRREEPTWKSARSIGHVLITLNRMDVILTPARNALDPNSQSVGNNRLHILVAMQSSKYQEASIDGKEALLDEVIQTVNTFWKGRFLVEGTDGHEELSREESRYALRSIFEMRSGQSLPKRHSLPAGGSSDPPPIAQQPVGLAKQASMTMIPSGAAVNLPDVRDLRSAAVKSLQKQKARQAIANRLEHVSRRNIPEGNTVAPDQRQRQPHQIQLQSHQLQPLPFAGRRPQQRESTVLGKLDASVMEQLVADFDDAEFNDEDNPEPLPPTNSNKFGSQFTGRGNFM